MSKSCDSFAPAEFALSRSRSLGWLATALHFSALAPTLFLLLPAEARLLWWVLVVYSLRWSFKRLRNTVGELRLLADGTWLWRQSDGQARLTDWIAHPWVCVLYLRYSDARREILLLPRDSLDGAAHRRLRALLRVRFRSVR